MTNRQKRKILDSYANSPKPSKLDDDNKVVVRYRQKGKTYDQRVIIPVKPETDEEKKLLRNNKNLYLAIQVDKDSKSGLSKSGTQAVRNKENTRTFNLSDLEIVTPTKVKRV